jgi:TPR repeat protein
VAIGMRICAATALLAVLLFLIPTVHVPKDQTTGETPAITTVHTSQTTAKNPVPDSSHERVTDSAAAAALRDLSRFEIPGLLRQARYGDDSAAFMMGMAYETGHGVPQDCAKAAHWVYEAASGGNAAAEYNLSLRYRYGDGVPANAEESEKWFRKAADRNYSHAQAVSRKLTRDQTRASLSQP